MMSDNKDMSQFFYQMYERFGQWSVINFVRDRQLNGELTQVSWADCPNCEEHIPVLDKACLVCGGIQ